MGLPLKPRSACAFDQVSLGEVMLRLDPGEGRIRTARRFTAWAGGGEYNTSCGLRKVFGCRTAVVTALVDNEIGRLVEGLIVEAGVSTEFIRWREDDGIGRETRNGLNFTERGSGIRGALGVSDRARTAVSQLKPGDIDWDHLFGRLGVRWFHTGGIFAALSDTTAEVAVEAVEAARRHGTIVSCDLNFRASLWRERGGVERAREVNRAIVRSADVLIDCMAPLGLPGVGESGYGPVAVRAAIEAAVREFPNLKVVTNTLRRVITASRNDWAALLWHDGRFYGSRRYSGLEILDRVGGGDSFASGLQFGFLEFNDPRLAVEYGAAHGALASTTPGDTSIATRWDAERSIAGESARLVS